MKVLLVNTSDQEGGAAIAATRLLKALRSQNVEAKLLVKDKTSTNKDIIALPRKNWQKKILYFLDRLLIFLFSGFNKQVVFKLSSASFGFNITKLPAFQEADIIHLHFITFGFLSLKNLQQILTTGKKVVWTMHDTWAFSALAQMNTRVVETYSFPPLQYLANKVRRKKTILYQSFSNLHIIGCSQWMTLLAKESSLLKHLPISHLANPIDLQRYIPQDRNNARRLLGLPLNKTLLLFVAYNVTDPRKGLNYLAEALQILQQKAPQLYQDLEVVLVGKKASMVNHLFQTPIHTFEQTKDEHKLIQLYNACEALVMPTLFDNLPNTAIEAMACGTPVIGFNVGGMAEIIDHQINGYLATPKDTNDLVQGLTTCFDAYAFPLLSRMARKKIEQTFSETKIAQEAKHIYQQLSF